MRVVRQVAARLRGLGADGGTAATAASTPTELRLATVLDTMSESCFAHECTVTPVTVRDWRAQLTADRPDLLLVESAWRGSGGSWEYKVGSYAYAESRGLPDLKQLVRWCRNHDVPTVFWNKEDPVHFAKFREAARLFDVVFTTDENMVERYAALKGTRTQQVAPLPFAAQPALHNPVALDQPRDPRPCFAGTFYRNRHEDRRRQLEMLLDAARAFDLVIYDRMHGQSGDTFGFPERFAPHVAGSLPYAEMNLAYKRFRVFLNANSVVDSPTMFSRRVFELLACGTPVVSTPSAGVERMFGDIVAIVDAQADAQAHIERLLDDDEHWTAVAAAGLRRVLAEHTYAHRLATIARAAGLDIGVPREPISALWTGDNPRGVGLLAESLLQQSLHPAEVVVCWAGDGIPTTALLALEEVIGAGAVHVVAGGHVPSERQRTALAAAAATHEWSVVLDGAALAPATLEDLSACRRFAAADVIGIAHTARQRHRYTHIRAAPVLARTDVVARAGWPPGEGAPVARSYAI